MAIAVVCPSFNLTFPAFIDLPEAWFASCIFTTFAFAMRLLEALPTGQSPVVPPLIKMSENHRLNVLRCSIS